MKKITFQCKNKDSEILGIVICILLFLAGWLISSAIARTYGSSILITVGVPNLPRAAECGLPSAGEASSLI